MKSKRKCFINIFLFLISSIFALSSAELFAKKLLKIPSFSSFHARYSIDGYPSYVVGYVCSDKTMPYALKPHFSHAVSDNGWHPLPFEVTLDEYGYRNGPGIDGSYDNVIVGDSVAFGFGVNDDQTISSALSHKTKQKVYSLAIPGAGPAMYVQMIYRFLKRAKTKKITVLFYDSNDYANLQDSCWQKSNLEALLKTKIYRKDVSDRPAHPTVFVFKSLVLRNSSLFFGIYESFIARRSTNMFSNDIEYETNLEKTKLFRCKALKYLNELVVASCVDEKAKQDILNIIKKIKKGEENNSLLQTMRDVTLRLIRQNCYPIGEDKINLLSYSHSHVYRYVNYGKNKEVVKNDNS
ncbi:hypothetical protein KA005_02520, partial [bacterium]|nr:hypothetical protein [bacterium]